MSRGQLGWCGGECHSRLHRLVGNHVGGLFVAPRRIGAASVSLLLDHASERLDELTVEIYEQTDPPAPSIAAAVLSPSAGKSWTTKEALPLLRMKRGPDIHVRRTGPA